MNIDLKPCPGCGEADVRVIGGPGTRGGPQYWAGCVRCRWRTWGDTEAEAIVAWNTRPAPTEAEVEASSLLKMIATEYLSVQPFDMPTGQGDADIGWQVMAPEGKVLAEVFSDNLLTALRMARAALGVG